MSNLENDSKEYSSMEREVQMLEASSPPDVIIADKGAIAVRDGVKYNFFIAGHGSAEIPWSN
jgi:hypothetical protein